jgi:hypothetical protein
LGRKVLICALIIAGVGALLSLGRIWLADPQGMERELREEFALLLESPMDAQSAKVDLFPIPRVSYENVRLGKDGVLALDVEKAEILLSPISLVLGRLRILELEATFSRLDLENPAYLARSFGKKGSHLLQEMMKMHLEAKRVSFPLAPTIPAFMEPCSVTFRRGITGATLELGFDLKLTGGEVLARGAEFLLQISKPLELRIAKGTVREPEMDLRGEMEIVPQSGALLVRVLLPHLDMAPWARLLAEFPGLRQLEMMRRGKLEDFTLGISFKEEGGSFSLSGVNGWGRWTGVELNLPEPWGPIREAQGRAKISATILTLSHIRGIAPWGRILDGDLQLDLSKASWNPKGELTLDVDLGKWYPSLSLAARGSFGEDSLRGFFGVKGNAEVHLFLSPEQPTGWVKWSARNVKVWARHRKLPYALEVKGEEVSFGKGELSARNVELGLGSSQVFLSRAYWDFTSQWVNLQAQGGTLELDEIWALLEDIVQGIEGLGLIGRLSGKASIHLAELEGNLHDPASWDGVARVSLKAEGTVMGFRVVAREASMELTPQILKIEGAQVDIPDGTLGISGQVMAWSKENPRAELHLEGEIGGEVLEFLVGEVSSKLKIPLKVPERIKVSSCELELSRGRLNSKAKLIWTHELDVQTALREGELELLSLRILGGESHGEISLSEEKGLYSLVFKGVLHGSTLEALLDEGIAKGGTARGDITVRWKASPEASLDVRGELHIHGMSLGAFAPPLWVMDANLVGEGDKLRAEKVRILLKGKEVSLEGYATLKDGVWIEAKARTEKARLQETIEALGFLLMEERRIKGGLELDIHELEVPPLLVSPFKGFVELGQARRLMRLTKSRVCGIEVTGEMTLDEEPEWMATFRGKGISLSSLSGCLGLNLGALEGALGVKGSLSSKGLDLKAVEALGGFLEMDLSGLSLPEGLWTEVFGKEEGSLKDSMDRIKMAVERSRGKGRARFKGPIEDGIFSIQEGSFRGEGIDAVGMGEVDLPARQMKIDILARLKEAIHGKGSPKDEFLALRIYGSLGEPIFRKVSVEELPVGLLGELARQRPTDTAQKRGRGSRR